MPDTSGRCPTCGQKFSPQGLAIHHGIKHHKSRRAVLEDALRFTAIPTLLVFAEDNSGAREAVRHLRAILGEPHDA